jgi:hypothetical protein
MPNYKIDFLFSTATGLPAGWSETVYAAFGTAAAALDWAKNGQYRTARLNLLDPGYAQDMIRVSDVTIRGDSLTDFAEPGTSLGTYPVPPGHGDVSEEPWDAILIRMLATPTNNRRRSFLMRGISGGVSQQNYSYNPNATWLPLFTAWKDQVKSVPLLMRLKVVHLDGNPPTDFSPIRPSEIEVSSDARSLIITFPATATNVPPAGSFFTLKGADGAWPINKNWKVQTFINNQIFTHAGRNVIWGTPELGRALVQQYTYDYQPILQVDAVRGAKRSTGRPFQLLRGRRSVPGA